jgi:hypothetical protein
VRWGCGRGEGDGMSVVNVGDLSVLWIHGRQGSRSGSIASAANETVLYWLTLQH